MKKMTEALRKLSVYAKPYRGTYALAIIFTISMVFFNAIWPLILGKVISKISSNIADKVSIEFDYVGKICVLILVVALIYQVSMYLSSYLMSVAVQKSMRDLRSDIDDKINLLPVSYFDRNKQGNILSRITNDVDAITNALQQSVTQAFSAILSIIMAVFMMFYINWVMALCSLIMIPASLLISRYIVKKSQPYFKGQQNALGDLNGFVQENYTGFTVLKVFGQEEKITDDFKTVNHRLADYGFKAAFISGIMMPLVGLTANLTYAAMAVLGGYFVLAGSVALGNLQAFIQYIWQVNQPLSQMTQLAGMLQSAAAAVERVFEVLDEPNESVENATAQLPENVKGAVAFDNVSFGYSPDKPLIKNLNFKVESGQTVAIVGPTGAGKTTLINLLLRFYDVDQGAIKIDGVPTKTLSRRDVRSQFGMVLQDAWLYHASISDNIRFGKLDASEYEVADAAKTANVHHFIKTLPDGYQMEINEEASNISLGQKQLLTIARAVIANPKILILDEATSSVDTRLEMLIQKAMKRVMKERTSFVIAHRLSTIRDADLILVMNQGEIIEQGTHQSLLAQGGFYENLYNSQFAEE